MPCYSAPDVSKEAIEMNQSAPIPFRGVKLNLPWNSYRVHPSLTRHDATMRDPEFWRRIIPFFADCGFNALTLWSIHPWSLMVRPRAWPDACGFSDAELAEWQALWRLIFGLGREHAIEVIPVCFNIFVSPELARSRGLAAYSGDLATGYNGVGDYSPEVRAYNREIVREAIAAYPEMGGIGVSQNERMEGVSLQEWQDWIAETYFDLAEELLQEKTFIVRAHTRPAPAMTRAAIESYPGSLPQRTLVDLKFNWSHGHAAPGFEYMHEGDSGEALRDPPPERFKLVFTVRNEDFFGLEYGSTSFMRELIEANARADTAGFIIGSECLIPAQEYIVRPPGGPQWDFLYQRQPLFWSGWGTLLANPEADEGILTRRYAEVSARHCGAAPSDASALFRAADLACRTANHIATSIASTWDFTLYTEGMIKGVRQDWFGQPFDAASPLLRLRELADARPLDPRWCSIREYAGGLADDDSAGPDAGAPVSPADRANQLRSQCGAALGLLRRLAVATAPSSQIEGYERASAAAWAHLGLCFAERIDAAVALARIELAASADGPADGDADGGTLGELKTDLFRALSAARGHYAELCATLDPWIPEPYELLHLGDRYTAERFDSPMERFHHRAVLALIDEEIADLERELPAVPQ